MNAQLRTQRIHLRGRPAAGLLVVAAAIVQAGLNFLLHTYASRHLGVETYGQLAALLNLTLFIAVPLGAVQLATATATGASESVDTTHTRAGVIKNQAIIWAVVAAAVTAIVAAPVAYTLGLDMTGPVWALPIYIGASTLGAAWRGVALGRGRYGYAGASVAVGATTRLLIAIPAITVFGVWGAMAATVIGETLSTLTLLPALKDKPTYRRAVTVSVTDAFTATGAFISLWLLTSIDALLAVTLLPAYDAGQYAAATTIARTALMVAATIAGISVARFAAIGTANSNGAYTTWKRAQLLVAALTIPALAAIPFTATVLTTVFGPAYADASTLTTIAIFAAIAYGGVTVNVYYLQARKARSVRIVWAFAVAELVTLLAWHPNANALAYTSLAVAVAACIATSACVVANRHRHLADPYTNTARHIHDPIWNDTADTADTTIDVSIVIPHYNTDPTTLTDTITTLSRTLERTGRTYEIVTVDDGSTPPSDLRADTTGGRHGTVTHLTHHHNRGKGAALATGFANCHGTWIGFLDADGDIHPDHIGHYLATAESTGADIVTGSKTHPLSTSNATTGRAWMSGALSTVNTRLFKLPVADTQVGAKLFARHVIADILPHTREDAFAFDVELFVAATSRGHTHVVEAPVDITRTGPSTVTTRTTLTTLTGLLGIYTRNLAGAYRHTDPD